MSTATTIALPFVPSNNSSIAFRLFYSKKKGNNEITSRVNAETLLYALDSDILQLNVRHLALARIPSCQKKTIQRGLLFVVDAD